MKKQAVLVLPIGLLLILDSRCASQSAAQALELCLKTLIPSLFPLFVLSALLMPALGGMGVGWLSRLLGMPGGSEGFVILGCAGGFPVGASAISEAYRSGGISRQDAQRMLGFCSFCGPAFLFGVVGQVLNGREALHIFLIQLETALLVGALWPGKSHSKYCPAFAQVTLPQAVSRSIRSMATVCAWVVLAGTATGILGKWMYPLLPGAASTLLTGIMELTNGIFLLSTIADSAQRFILASAFVCFGGMCVLLQIGGLAASAGLSVGECCLQKTAQGILGAILAAMLVRFGSLIHLLPTALLFLKIAVEIPGRMVYNGTERKGSECCFGKKWSAPVYTAVSAQK